MKTLIHTRIYALLTQNESNPSELAHAYEEFIETMTEMVANFDNRDDILRILYYSRVEFDVLSHPSFNRYSNNVLRTTFIYKIMYNPLAELSQCILDSSNGSIINVI